MDITRLQRHLGVSFTAPSFLFTALTHRSHSTPHNERLEFLGDSVLNCVVAHLLYAHFPQLPEGDLSRLRALLVCEDSLFQLAQQLKLGDFLQLGQGELRSGGHQRPSILADAFEAIIGAIFLDAGFMAAQAWLTPLFQPLIDALPTGQRMKDAKTRLQEWLQGRRHGLPKYSLKSTQGEAHAQRFDVLCEIPALRISTEGSGTSRRIAEQIAAERALEILEK